MSDPYLIESKREEHVLQLLRLTNSLLARHRVHIDDPYAVRVYSNRVLYVRLVCQ